MSPTRSRAFCLMHCALLTLLIIIIATPCLASEPSADEGHADDKIGAHLPLWSVIPFAGILLSIALFPLFAPKWWHHHFPKVSAFWALLFCVPFLIAFRREAVHEILHVYMLEYLPFIILLWALFTISGGIHIRGTLRGSPGLNLVLLILGTGIASWVGTTGASMILIRPILRANEWRKQKVHVIIFFIFLVSNIGGSLTPLGDPPLFLGFLLGVPFFWTMQLLEQMAFVAFPLFALFFLIDTFYFKKETRPEPVANPIPIRIEGAHNILFLLGVVGAVLMSGIWKPGEMTILGIHVPISGIARDVAILACGALSLFTTRKSIHEANGFNWFPIQEVAFLFAGIFMTIIPAIAILKAGAEGGFAFVIEALKSPAHYFWITGGLSAFLDNAPSYLTLFNSVLGKFHTGVPLADAVPRLLEQQPIYVKAISLGAVFFGALTYIGNAPNFMVKSIAEEAGIKMPSFFGFIVRFSLPVLVPIFVILTLVFF